MSKKIFKILRTVHAWGGATLSLLFIMISLTGTLLVWKSEYLWLTMPEARVDFTSTPETLALIANKIDESLVDEIVFSIQFATEQLPLTFVSMADEKYAYFDTQGKLIDQWQGNGRLEEWIYDLHHRLLLGNLGLTIVGYGAMAMSLLLFAGLASFWPHRKGFRLGFRPKDTSRLQLLKTHRNIGIIVAVPFFMTLITGIILVYPNKTEEIFLDSVRMSDEYNSKMVENLDGISGDNSGEWLPAMQRALAVFPGAKIRSAQVPGAFTGYRIIGLQQAGEWNRTGMSRIYIDAYEGYMDIRMDALTGPAIERAFNAVTPLHTGKMNFLWYKLLLTISGLSILLISCFGLLAFIKGKIFSKQ